MEPTGFCSVAKTIKPEVRLGYGLNWFCWFCGGCWTGVGETPWLVVVEVDCFGSQKEVSLVRLGGVGKCDWWQWERVAGGTGFGGPGFGGTGFGGSGSGGTGFGGSGFGGSGFEPSPSLSVWFEMKRLCSFSC